MRIKKFYYIIGILVVCLLCRIHWYYERPNAIFSSSIVTGVAPYLWDKYGYNGKMWLHRTDNIIKLTTTAIKYAGVELDLVYFKEDNNFDVSHDPNDILEYPIEDFIPIIKQNNQMVWLDYKNLSLDNAEISMLRLDDILLENNLSKEMCIIESPNYNALKVFHDNGYYTSYYVPTDEDETLFINEVKLAAASGNIDAVSFPTTYYYLVKKTNVSLDYLTWQCHNATWMSFYVFPELKEILDDNRVKVILVYEESSIER